MSSSGAVAYLVLAHERPEQVALLARRICALSPAARVLVHWDAGASAPFPSGLLPDRAEMLPDRVRAGWGRWSLVEATLRLLAAARNGYAPRWSVLVSGADWPARPLADWERALDLMGADALVESAPFPAPPEDGGTPVTLHTDWGLRYESRWWFAAAPRRQPVRRTLDALARRVERVEGHRASAPAALLFSGRGYAVAWRRARLPRHGWTLWKGSQWLTLGPAAVDAVLAAPADLQDHFRRTLIPDEAFVQTVVHNTPGMRVRYGTTSYAPWHAASREPSLVLRDEDLGDVAASGAAFARKIGAGRWATVTDTLDRAVDAARTGQRDPAAAEAGEPRVARGSQREP